MVIGFHNEGKAKASCKMLEACHEWNTEELLALRLVLQDLIPCVVAQWLPTWH